MNESVVLVGSYIHLHEMHEMWLTVANTVAANYVCVIPVFDTKGTAYAHNLIIAWAMQLQ